MVFLQIPVLGMAIPEGKTLFGEPCQVEDPPVLSEQGIELQWSGEQLWGKQRGPGGRLAKSAAVGKLPRTGQAQSNPNTARTSPIETWLSGEEWVHQDFSDLPSPSAQGCGGAERGSHEAEML